MQYYDLKPLTLGCEVFNIDLNDENNIISNLLIQQIKDDVLRYKILIFRNQSISPKRQLEITRWFGVPEERGIESHATLKGYPGLLKVSNDEQYGLKGFGTTGFHIDGVFLNNPCAYSIYHIVKCPNAGKTVFVDLNKIIINLSEERRRKWEKLYPVRAYKAILGSPLPTPAIVVHPLIYPHPATNQPTMAISLGKTNRFICNPGMADERRTKKAETVELLSEIQKEFDRTYQYGHEWETGDFIISDNLAVAHMADADTQRSPNEIGLRVMHRTCVQGYCVPFK